MFVQTLATSLFGCVLDGEVWVSFACCFSHDVLWSRRANFLISVNSQGAYFEDHCSLPLMALWRQKLLIHDVDLSPVMSQCCNLLFMWALLVALLCGHCPPVISTSGKMFYQKMWILEGDTWGSPAMQPLDLWEFLPAPEGKTQAQCTANSVRRWPLGIHGISVCRESKRKRWMHCLSDLRKRSPQKWDRQGVQCRLSQHRISSEKWGRFNSLRQGRKVL